MSLYKHPATKRRLEQCPARRRCNPRRCNPSHQHETSRFHTFLARPLVPSTFGFCLHPPSNRPLGRPLDSKTIATVPPFKGTFTPFPRVLPVDPDQKPRFPVHAGLQPRAGAKLREEQGIILVHQDQGPLHLATFFGSARDGSLGNSPSLSVKGNQKLEHFATRCGQVAKRLPGTNLQKGTLKTR